LALASRIFADQETAGQGLCETDDTLGPTDTGADTLADAHREEWLPSLAGLSTDGFDRVLRATSALPIFQVVQKA
jgi:hypothetical protein